MDIGDLTLIIYITFGFFVLLAFVAILGLASSFFLHCKKHTVTQTQSETTFSTGFELKETPEV